MGTGYRISTIKPPLARFGHSICRSPYNENCELAKIFRYHRLSSLFSVLTVRYCMTTVQLLNVHSEARRDLDVWKNSNPSRYWPWQGLLNLGKWVNCVGSLIFLIICISIKNKHYSFKLFLNINSITIPYYLYSHIPTLVRLY